MTATKPEPTAAVYRRCAAAVERAIAAIQANPSLYRNRAARNKLVELAAAAKQLDRQLDGHGSDDDDHFGEAFAAAALDMKVADVDALAACAAAADDDEPRAAATPVPAAGDVAPTPASRPLDADAKKKKKHKSKKRRVREKKRAARAAAEEAELPPCREIATPPAVLEALKASERAATPEPTAEPAPSKPGGASSWGRGFLAIGTIAKEPDLRDPYAYIASTIDDDDLEPALHDAPSPNFDGLVIEEVTPEELARLELINT